MTAQIEDVDFKIPLETEEELKAFVKLAFGVVIPDIQVCENHSTPWRAFRDAYFAEHSVVVWKASRGFGGKSYLLALLALVEAVTLKASVNVLGGSGKQSANVLEHIADFWGYRHAPRQLLRSEPGKQETKIIFGNSVRALMASQTSVRGPHPQRLRLDEIDEMKLSILDASLGQPMTGSTGIQTQTVMSSTQQYADGTMSEVLRRAGRRGWPVHEWCYRETSAEGIGWLSKSEIERKKSVVTQMMWQIEYDLQEPSPEDRAIIPDAVKAMFKKSLGDFEGDPGQYIEIEAPKNEGIYVSGADWAKKQDWTVIGVLRVDVNPVRLVAFQRIGRLPWPIMTGKFDDVNTRYGVMAAHHDGTGLGDVVNDNLQTQSEAVIMVGRARQDMLSNFISAVEREEVESAWIRFAHDELLFASTDDVYKSGSGHLPDTLAMFALAWIGAEQGNWSDFTDLEVEEYQSRWD